jgi:hypothetical protein
MPSLTVVEGNSLMRTIAIAAVLAATILGLGETSIVAAATLTGTVQSGGLENAQPRSKVVVSLYEATELIPIIRGLAKTDAAGHFSITTTKTSTNSIFFAVASGDLGTDMVTIIGPTLPPSITINELTTVAAAYSMAQFYRTGWIAGSAFQLQLAAGMNDNIVSPVTGHSSEVLLTTPNSYETNSLSSTRSLANLVSICVRNPLKALAFYQLTKSPLGLSPLNMPQALANLARNPGQNVLMIYSMSMLSSVYSPALTQMPDAWTITVKVNDSGDDANMFGGPGNIAFDSQGYAWIANNVIQGTPNSTTYCIVLKPNGKPSDGTNGRPTSPFTGGGLLGTGFGVTIDPTSQTVWYGNFGWGGEAYQPSPTGNGSASQFTLAGAPLSGSNGYQGGLDRVQGLMGDRSGNMWLTSYGNDQLVVFLKGKYQNSINFPQPRDSKPFDVTVAPDGTAWLTNGGGFSGEGPCSVSRYRLATDPRTGKTTIQQMFNTPLGRSLKAVKLDSFGNAWVASQGDTSVYQLNPQGKIIGQYTGIGGVYYPWGIAIDGEDNVWVANFGKLTPNDVFDHSRISKLCGANPLTRPPFTKAGDAISPALGYTVPSAGEQVLLHNRDPLYGPGAAPAYTPMLRLTSVVIDQAGNVWAVNNWKPDFNTDITTNPGGDGVVIFVGLAPPPKK